MVARSAAAGLFVLGLFLLVVGGVTYSSCSASAVSTLPGTPQPICTFLLIPIVLAVALFIVGAVVVVTASRGYTYIPPVSNPAVPPPLIQPLVIEQTVQHEVVKVRCSYCGGLSDATAKTCASCGAPL